MKTNLTKFVNAVNWKYYLGEFFLIFAGILAAFAVNNWNTQRQERKVELSLLREMHAALTLDLAELRQAAVGFRTSEARLIALRNHLNGHLPYTDTLDHYFGAMYGMRRPNLHSAPYEALKTRGFDLISSDSLRLRIIRFYAERYASIEKTNEIQYNVTMQIMRPEFLAKFRDLRFNENAKPLDYQSIAYDRYFLNLLEYRLVVMRTNEIADYEQTTADALTLIGKIENKIRNLN